MSAWRSCTDTGNEEEADHDEQHLGDEVDGHHVDCSGNSCVDEAQSSPSFEVGCRIEEGENRGPGGNGTFMDRQTC